MGEIVNLRRARKDARKREEAKQAAANRIHYGRTKAEKTLQQARSEKDGRLLDAHRIETGDPQ